MTIRKERLVIIVCVAMLSIAIVWTQVSKQNSIEKQAQMKIDQENRVLQLEQDEKEAEKEELASIERVRKAMIELCINEAENSYWSYMELNGTKQDDGSINALTRFWDTAKEDKQIAIDLCYKKYE